MLENKGLYICKYLLSRDTWEQRIIYLQISFISWCLRTKDYMFIYIFYFVLLKNKGLYVYLYLLSRDAWEQRITCLHISSISYCVRTKDYILQISFISYCVRTRDYMFAYTFYLVMRKNKELLVCIYLLSRDA